MAIGNRTGKRRGFGSVRKLPSGRFQARLPEKQGGGSLGTFATKREAKYLLIETEVEQRRGSWVRQAEGDRPFGSYADAWIESNPRLRPLTQGTYRSQLKHLAVFEKILLKDIRPEQVRHWHSQLVRSGALSATTVAKVYRMFRQIMGQACDDGLIGSNPVHIKGAAAEIAPEPRPPTLVEVDRLVESIDPKYRCLVLLAAFGGLRFGELEFPRFVRQGWLSDRHAADAA